VGSTSCLVFDPRGTKIAEIDSPKRRTWTRTRHHLRPGFGDLPLGSASHWVKETKGPLRGKDRGTCLRRSHTLERPRESEIRQSTALRLWKESRVEGQPAIERFWQKIEGQSFRSVEPFPEVSSDFLGNVPLARGMPMTSYVGLIGGRQDPTWRAALSDGGRPTLVLDGAGCRATHGSAIRSSQARRQHIARRRTCHWIATSSARTDPLNSASGLWRVGRSIAQCGPPRPGHNVAEGVPQVSTGRRSDT